MGLEFSDFNLDDRQLQEINDYFLLKKTHGLQWKAKMRQIALK
jgi:hypothetical protein